MIYVSKEIPANERGQPKLNRSQIWKGLVMKAENALPFVPGMAKCNVVERTGNGLVRDIVFRGEDAREKVTFYPEEKVVFLRLSGNADGFIVNEVLGDGDDLRLRFSFALQLVDAPSDSAKEREFREVMERDYLKAVDATLGAIRKMVSESQPASSEQAAMKHWFSDLYASIDAMRLDEFVAGLTPDVEVVVGNNPAMKGRHAVKDGIGHFFSTIQGLKHNLVNVVEGQGLTFLEAKVDYLRKDGQQVTVPVVTVLERKGELVKSLRIYFDLAPVYA